MVNCKFRAQTPNYSKPNDPDEGYDSNSTIDYNFYASGNQESDIVFKEESGVAYAWEGYNYSHKNYHTGVVDANSVIATESDMKDPMFVNFNINGVGLTEYVYDETWDFHVNAGSPVLNGGHSGYGITPYFADGLTVNGKSYSSPAVSSHFGAFGTK